jgi:DNA-binding transcriptional regulator YdaS (Cro superfamily)
MNLREYLASPGALSVAQLKERIGAKSDDQVRQWQHGYAGRKPDPGYCMAIRKATGGLVEVWDLRPDDWHRIWPMFIGKKGAPPVSAVAANDHEKARA